MEQVQRSPAEVINRFRENYVNFARLKKSGDSVTTHYSKGKYVADGRCDPNAFSPQCGAAAPPPDLGAVHRAIRLRAPTFPTAAVPGASAEHVCPVPSRLRQLGRPLAAVDGCPSGPQIRPQWPLRRFSANAVYMDGKVGLFTWIALFA